jgi:hypothetical protein
VTNNPITSKAEGRFVDLAADFEKVIHPHMRSPPMALGKRLRRSMKRIAAAKVAADTLSL